MVNMYELASQFGCKNRKKYYRFSIFNKKSGSYI